jgi:cytochrome c biogenesis protein CcmG/thiol:disulfide interchange protein DsbE
MKMSRQWRIVGLILVLILILVGFGWLARDRFAPVVVGSPAPDFVATDLDGNTVRLSDLQGEVVLLNIWATWCPPCRVEMPSMQRLHEMLGPKGLKMVAVSVDAPIGMIDRSGYAGGDVQAFADEFALTFPIWLDPSGDVKRIYRAAGIPETFIIDRNGIIVRKVLSAIEWDSEANIESISRLLEM